MMKKIITFVFLLLLSLSGAAKNPKVWRALKKDVNIFVISDSGRNGYYDQKPIAATMGRMAESLSPECIVTSGDTHHFEGVQSVHDPLWMTNYELIYDHPKLMQPWLAVLGNHEYRGNADAVIEYSDISRRWNMPSRYYTKVYKDEGTTLRLVMIDTTPMIDRYRASKNVYASAAEQDYKAQLEWLDDILSRAKEDWVIVVGHHPIYAHSTKSKKEQTDMQSRVGATLLKHKERVDFYICGHIHNFQHIKKESCKIDYVVNSSAATSRHPKAIDGTMFCNGESGFSVLCADKQSLCLHMINKKGKVLHTIKRVK